MERQLFIKLHQKSHFDKHHMAVNFQSIYARILP